MTNEKDYEQQFNECCANIVGLKTGKGSTSPLYFKDECMHGKYECRIEDYVPYDSIDQLEKVVEILKSTLGITIDLEAQRRDGKLATYRSMVDDMLLVIDDCEEHPYETCAERMETEELEELTEMIETFAPEEDVLDVEEGWDEFDRLEMTHPMYDNNLREWIEENTKRQFEHSLRLNIGYNDTPNCSRKEYKTPKDVFNELCQRITKTANAPSYCIDASTFNPYQDILQLSRIVEIVIVATGEPFVVDGQDGVDMMKEMREHVEVYSAEKYMTLEEL